MNRLDRVFGIHGDYVNLPVIKRPTICAEIQPFDLETMLKTDDIFLKNRRHAAVASLTNGIRVSKLNATEKSNRRVHSGVME